MVGRISAFNQMQKIPQIPLSGVALSAPTNTIYTCPAGKRAIIHGIIYMDGFGASTTCQFVVNGQTLINFTSAEAAAQPQTYRTRTVTDIELAAGQTITKTQDAGVNAELRYNLSVLELSV